MTSGLVDRGARLFKDPKTGRFVIVQWPNRPLVIWMVAAAVLRLADPDGARRTALSVVAGVALAWWAVAEIRSGLSPFRRVLGAAVLVSLGARLLAR